MYSYLKTIGEEPLKSAFRKVGLEVTASSGAMVEYAVLSRLLRERNIDLVIDVGANTGQYGGLLRHLRYKGNIFSIEPLASAHRELLKKSNCDENWIVLPRMAVGAIRGKITINVSNNSVSSSLLPLLPSHVSSAPNSSYISTETVNLERLDDCMKEHVGNAYKSILLKIDTQGYEDAVLDGAVELLSQVDVVQCELSLRPLYEGQKLIEDVISKLRTFGFMPVALVPDFKDPKTHELLQCDGFFCRTF